VPTFVASRLLSLQAVSSTAQEHLDHPSLAVVSAMVPWRSLEPSAGVFDWAQMDANVADARAGGYRILLRIMAGRIAPTWLDEAGMQRIRVLGTDPNAEDYCRWIDAPLPWDAVLAARYADLMREVGRWLAEPDGAGGTKGDHIAAVPISMPSMLGSEMTIGYGADTTCPAGTEGADLHLRDTNRAIWDQVSSETDRRVWIEQAWRDAIAIHLRELPLGTSSVIAYGPLFLDQQASALRLAQSEVAASGGRLWSMYTNLQPNVRNDGSLATWRDWCPPCHQVMVAALDAGGVVGFQTAGAGRTDTRAKYEAAVEDGLSTYGMRFLETQPTSLDLYEPYLLTGSDPVQQRLARRVHERPTATAASCAATSVGVATTCSATVSDLDVGPAVTPVGSVTWTTSGSGDFSGSCALQGSGGASSCSVGFTPSASGTHTITAVWGGDGDHLGSGGQSSLEVAPPPGDTSPPSVALTAPVHGGTVPKGKKFTIQASASDESGVAWVEFFVNAGLRCTDTAAPYSCVWSVPKKAGVRYTVVAAAYDSVGNTTTHAVSVTAR